MPKKDKNPGGRPTIFSQKLANLICEKVASNPVGLKKLTQMFPKLPCMDTVYEWRHKYPKFSEQYAQAKLRQADYLAEEILEIADDASDDIKYDKDGNESCNAEFVARSRLRIDSRKWLASRLLPKQYGDKVTHEGKITISHEDALKELE